MVKDEEDAETDEEETEGRVEEDGADDGFGLFGLLMTVSKETCTPVQQIWDWSIGMFFWAVTYLIVQARKKEQALRTIKASR